MKEVLIVRDFGHQGFVTRVGFTHGRAIVPGLRIGQSECSSACVSSSSDWGRNDWLPCKGWRQEEGQDVAEYAVMLAVILAIAIGTNPADWIPCGVMYSLASAARFNKQPW